MIILSIYYILLFAIANVEADTCGYNACNLGDPNKLNVHLVPHSHDDVGFVKTIDQYYYGSQTDMQHAGVQYILDAVIHALDENPDRRFIYVEMAFFSRWWNEQSEEIRDKVRSLVNSGRLEFISGGWSMNDEAATHYNSIIDQHSLGLEFLREQFGECGQSKVGWQIDPFGHSREQTSLLAQMGFDGLFFGRCDYEDMIKRNTSKNMEMIWKASANLDRQSWLFTGILPRRYSTPTSFSFDFLYPDDPIMDNVNLPDYNVPQRVQTFIQTAINESNIYATNHIIMTFGGDFQYENAHANFKNLDKLIKYVNAEQLNGSQVNVFYSTPSCYLYALNKVNRSWSSKSDDFFPHAHHPHGFWTGYFTSRPALKRFERYSNNILQTTRQLNALSKSQLRNEIFVLSEAMGIAQHHDAVSGTEKQHVACDYAQRLSTGIDAALNVINQVYSKLLPKDSQTQTIDYQFLCPLVNISECLPIENQTQFTITIWNPTIHPVNNYLRVPTTKSYTIRGPNGESIPTDLLPIFDPTTQIPGRMSHATGQLTFRYDLPALGFNTYFFESKNDEQIKSNVKENEECTLQNQNLRVEIDSQGHLKNIINLRENISMTFSNQGFYFYQSFAGNNSGFDFQASGAYIFRPVIQNATSVSGNRSIKCLKSERIQIALIVFNDWASQEISLYDEGESVEIEWLIGPIPIDDQSGKEIILRYDTDINSQSKYYTDANGREVLERIRNYRPTFNYTTTEPISGNYYPVNSRIWINDTSRQLTILTDRSEGGASIDDGSIELMIHRRLLYDDHMGVGEALNETAYNQGLVVRGKHYLFLERPQSSAFYHRVRSQELYMHPLATYSLVKTSYSNYSNSFHQTWSAINRSLPLNVHLLTFDQLNSNDYLIRIEHYFELNEDKIYSQMTIIDLQDIFQSIGQIKETVELTLSANLELSRMQRLNWFTDNEQLIQSNFEQTLSIDTNSISLKPMQIRTFRVTIA